MPVPTAATRHTAATSASVSATFQKNASPIIPGGAAESPMPSILVPGDQGDEPDATRKRVDTLHPLPSRPTKGAASHGESLVVPSRRGRRAATACPPSRSARLGRTWCARATHGAPGGVRGNARGSRRWGMCAVRVCDRLHARAHAMGAMRARIRARARMHEATGGGACVATGRQQSLGSAHEP